ncbi:hypothetical protein POF45_25540 [Pseudomonas sp. 681]|jgi:hypothetical protein|uniref:Serine kinase/phosphatase n=2 Tax=Pseudomonas TaxID=286 RepID=A0ABT6QVB5_9PSED|nr:hypothetical protein [Pseudomonas sp. 681]MDI2594766.1 hypothetical protein [Pseudomonas sp. 681]
MTPETEGTQENGPDGLPFINDPGNEDPGSLMDDATVPLNDSDDAGDVGGVEDDEEDETPEYPLPSPTDSLSRDERPPEDDGVEEAS